MITTHINKAKMSCMQVVIHVFNDTRSQTALNCSNKQYDRHKLPSLKGRIKEAQFQSQFIPFDSYSGMKTPNFQHNSSMCNFESSDQHFVNNLQIVKKINKHNKIQRANNMTKRRRGSALELENPFREILSRFNNYAKNRLSKQSKRACFKDLSSTKRIYNQFRQVSYNKRKEKQQRMHSQQSNFDSNEQIDNIYCSSSSSNENLKSSNDMHCFKNKDTTNINVIAVSDKRLKFKQTEIKSSDSNQIDSRFGLLNSNRKMTIKLPENTQRIAQKRVSVCYVPQ